MPYAVIYTYRTVRIEIEWVDSGKDDNRLNETNKHRVEESRGGIELQ
jgi:hypothetical protein